MRNDFLDAFFAAFDVHYDEWEPMNKMLQEMNHYPRDFLGVPAMFPFDLSSPLNYHFFVNTDYSAFASKRQDPIRDNNIAYLLSNAIIESGFDEITIVDEGGGDGSRLNTIFSLLEKDVLNKINEVVAVDCNTEALSRYSQNMKSYSKNIKTIHCDISKFKFKITYRLFKKHSV
jgi:hypothetical protein